MTEQLKECSGECRQLKTLVERLNEIEATADRAESSAALLRVDFENLRTAFRHLGYRMDVLEEHVKSLEDDQK